MKYEDFFIDGFYKDHVISQVCDMGIGGVIKADLGSKDASSFRMNLNKYGVKTNKKFKTRIMGGELLVGRMN